MNSAEVILSLAGTAASLLITCVIFVIKLAKAVKDKRNIVNRTVLDEAVAPLIEVAEKFCNYSGEEKKQFVLTKINQFAIENNLKFDVDEMSRKIERLIELSRQVNEKN